MSEKIEIPKTLKMVFAIRHGHYNRASTDKELTEFGKKQINVTASKLGAILERVGYGSVKIACSTHRRAEQSAEILKTTLSERLKIGEICSVPYLCRDYYEQYRADIFQELFPCLDDCSALVAVTHFEAPRAITDLFSKVLFGKTFGPYEYPLADGCGICLKTGTIYDPISKGVP